MGAGECTVYRVITLSWSAKRRYPCEKLYKRTRFYLGEALQLAEDFSYLTQHFFPTGAVATAMNKKAIPAQHRTQENVAHRLNAIQMTKFLIQFLFRLIATSFLTLILK